MKIDPVTFEVDASGGTRPVYVWEAPVRVWHWLMAVAMFAMIITGYLIGRPLVSNLGDTWITYDFRFLYHNVKYSRNGTNNRIHTRSDRVNNGSR